MIDDGFHAISEQIEPKNVSNNTRFWLMDFKPSVAHAVAVCFKPCRLALLELISDSPLAVFRNTSAFFLRIGGKDGKHQLAIAAEAVQVLLFEKNVHLQRFKLSNGVKQRHRVTSKSGDGLCDDHINFSASAIVQQALKPFPGFFCSGNRFV